MILVGEKLNSSIPRTMEAIQNHDEAYLIDLIVRQEKDGADFLDINTAISTDRELAEMCRILELAQKHSRCHIMLDSPDPQVVKEAIRQIRGREVIINSVTLTQRIDELMDTIRKYNASVVCLPIDESGISGDPARRVETAGKIIQKLRENGIGEEKIYIDVLAEALSVDDRSVLTTLETIRLLRKAHPHVKSICGLSNISFGLPGRALLNTSFLAMAIFCGLDSAILDVTSSKIKETLVASRALCGQDEYCMDYIGYMRNGC